MAFKLFLALFTIAISITTCSSLPHNCTDSVNIKVCESRSYCNCDGNVINCDFTNIDVLQSNQKLCVNLEQGWEHERKDTQRMCFCGGSSRSTEFMFSTDLITKLPFLHRVDFYKMAGHIRLNKTFGNDFAGDIYMSDVRLNTIHDYEFDKQNNMTITDVSDIECCSKIPMFLSATHPVLSINNSVIGLVKQDGIADYNQFSWKTVLFNNVTFEDVQSNGIVTIRPEANVSITDCTFLGMSEYALSVFNASNVFFARNVVRHVSNVAPIIFDSTISGSTTAMVGNYFNDGIHLRVQADRVFIWLNRFDTWYSHTFHHLKLQATNDSDSKVSVAWNAIKTVTPDFYNISEAGISSDLPNVKFRYNVFGDCSCQNTELISSVPANVIEPLCEYGEAEKNNTCRMPLQEYLEKYCKPDGKKAEGLTCRAEDRHDLMLHLLTCLQQGLEGGTPMKLDDFLINMILTTNTGVHYLPTVDHVRPSVTSSFEDILQILKQY